MSMSMSRNEKIQYILGNDPSYGMEDLKEMSSKELDAIIEDLNDDSDMYPNGRDYDAEDEG